MFRTMIIAITVVALITATVIPGWAGEPIPGLIEGIRSSFISPYGGLVFRPMH